MNLRLTLEAIRNLPETEIMQEEELQELLRMYLKEDDAKIISHRWSGEGSGALDHYYWRIYDFGRLVARSEGSHTKKMDWNMFERLIQKRAVEILRGWE